MLKSQTLALEASKKRQRINELLALEELDTEQRGELDTLSERMGEVESEYRAAIVSEAEIAGEHRRDSDEKPEERELRQLVEGASIGSIFQAAVEHRSTERIDA